MIGETYTSRTQAMGIRNPLLKIRSLGVLCQDIFSSSLLGASSSHRIPLYFGPSANCTKS